MPSNPRSLLIMSCSQQKRVEPSLLPAIERYDGPAFRVLRRFLKDQSSKSLDIYILSAKFGLISADQSIPYYDQRMTILRGQELNPEIIDQLGHIFSCQFYQRLCLCMGKDYFHTLNGYLTLIPAELTVKVVTGSPGKKLAELHRWLYEKSLAQSQSLPTAVTKGKARLRGTEIALTPTQVLEVAQHALIEGQGDPSNYQSWYVQIDGQRVAPKWLVSHLTGLPISAFVTEEARRVLAQLGIEVRQT